MNVYLDNRLCLPINAAAKFLKMSAASLANMRTYQTGPRFIKVKWHSGWRVFYPLDDLTEYAKRRGLSDCDKSAIEQEGEQS